MPTIEENIFKRSQIDFTKLTDFGFQKADDMWIYQKEFMNNQFRAVVKISSGGKVSGDVFETDSDDIYFPLRVESMEAGFVGEVRAEYKKILQNIKQYCCVENYFIFPQTNRIAHAVYQKYGDKPIFPWEKFSGYGVFKNPDNNKWYALIGNLDKSKLDKTKSGETEIANLKLDEEKIQLLLKQKGFYSAYHMNKKYWITIILDDTIDDKTILELFEESHHFTEKNIHKSTPKKSLNNSG